ncbi:MAG: ribonuclease III domain-containing protein, partial [Candidatus Thorarchaeota archaeon]|nr:ribonuclease III domain-containing protein [Candidatus Thorarchaeota archaeon]
VIDMAVLHLIWKPKASDVGTLTQDRANIVNNQHLSQKCDEWELYENRIHFDPATPSKSEMEHDKGTLVEALYGVLYVELGFSRVRELVTHLL